MSDKLRIARERTLGAPSAQGDRLLYLTDAQMRESAELMFFAYRAFTQDPDEILKAHGYWRAHHRALHFIGARKGLSVGDLMEILGVTKQSLNRVLRELLDNGLVAHDVAPEDRRRRLLRLTEAGAALERRLADGQRTRLRQAFRAAGPEAVAGFRAVLEGMLDPETHRLLSDAPDPSSNPPEASPSRKRAP